MQREQLSAWSKWLHRNAPQNIYYRQKVPWKTIFVSFLFFIGGLVFLSLGFIEWAESSFSDAYEKLILGSILFIPGVYHTVLAIQALRGIEGWGYENLTVFENENFFNDDS